MGCSVGCRDLGACKTLRTKVLLLIYVQNYFQLTILHKYLGVHLLLPVINITVINGFM